MSILKNGFFFLLLAGIATAAAAQNGFKQLPSGLRYKIISSGKGVFPKPGNAIQVHTTQTLGDSVLFTTYPASPSLLELSKTGMDNDFIKIFMMMRTGDSAVYFQTAAALKKLMTELPPFMKITDTLFGFCKTMRIYPGMAAARAQKLAEQKAVIVTQQARIQQYLAQNNITTQPTPKGCFITIMEPGSGPAVTKGSVVTMQYTGSKFDGTVFDSSIDSAFGHPEPYSFTVGTGAVIAGFEEAVLKLKKGGRCKIYIPAVLAYGERGSGANIGPNEDLIFEILLNDVVPPAAVKKPQPGKIKMPKDGNPKKRN